MTNQLSLSRKIFITLNYTFLIVMALLCIFPIVHVLAVSFSTSSAAAAGAVKLWPVDFTMVSYQFILQKPVFLHAFGISLQRLILGSVVNMFLVILIAYPLSKETKSFRLHNYFTWYFVITILFNSGLIPWYMTIKYTGIMDSLWALVLPGAVPVFNVILLLNFFRALPKELEEAAFIDGASHWVTLWRIYVPLSMPALATILLFTMVGHWNAWFDGLILMNSRDHYPLSSYLQTVIINQDLTKLSGNDAKMLARVNDQTAKSAQIFLASLPILLVYPFLQRFFIKGIVLGSVKG